jgi:hypothetical protein
MKCFMITAIVVFMPVLSQGQAPPAPLSGAAYRTQLFISMVLRDYYTIPYGVQLTVLANAARDGNGQIDAKAIQQALTDATMNI